MLFRRKACSEVIQSGLRDNSGVTYPSISPTANREHNQAPRRTKPPSIGLDSPRSRLVLSLLKSGSLDHLALTVIDGLAALHHLQPPSGFGIMVKVLALDFLRRGVGHFRLLGRTRL